MVFFFPCIIAFVLHLLITWARNTTHLLHQHHHKHVRSDSCLIFISFHMFMHTLFILVFHRNPYSFQNHNSPDPSIILFSIRRLVLGKHYLNQYVLFSKYLEMPKPLRNLRALVRILANGFGHLLKEKN